MKPPWWLGLEPATATAECSGTQHRLEWSAGRLRPLDHADADAEEALAVLGDANRAPCIAIVDAWRRHQRTVQLVTLGRRPGEGPIGYPPEAAPRDLPTRAALQRKAKRSAAVRSILDGREVAALLTLPGPLVDRLVLTAMASCVERWDDEGFRFEHGLRIGAALSVRATPALRRFGEQLGHGTPVVTVSPSQPGAGPSVLARLERHQPMVVTAELPVGWLVDVWGRGISEPDDRLVLGVRDADEAGREFLVDVAEWEPAGPDPGGCRASDASLGGAPPAGPETWELAAVPARLVRDGDGCWRVAAA